MMQRMKGTLRPGRKAGVLALAVLLLTCVLMAGAVSASDEVGKTVYSYDELVANLSNSSVTEIILGSDITASAEISVNRSVTIDGKYHTISAKSGWSQDDGYKNLLVIENGTSGVPVVTLENISFECYGNATAGDEWYADSSKRDALQQYMGAHGIQVYDTGTTQMQLKDITINASQGSGIHVNGANVALVNVTVKNSVWQSVDVGKGEGVTNAATLTIDGDTELLDAVKINVDNPSTDVTVTLPDDTSYKSYSFHYNSDGKYGKKKLVWSTDVNAAAEKIAESKKVIFTATVQNTGDDPLAYHAGFSEAMGAAEDGATVTQLQELTLTEKLTINKKITFNGGGKTLTLNTPEKSTSITVNNGATLENLNVVAAENAGFYIGIQLNDGTLNESSIDLSNQTCYASARAVVISKGTVSNNTIQAGNSDTSSSQCVVVSGSDVTVSDNTLTTGKSAAERDGKRTSGSVGIRLSSGASGTTIITDNTITSKLGAGLNNGIAADGVKTNVNITASGNTFALATTEYDGGAFYVNPTTDAITVTINAEKNTVKSAASFIYADNAEGAETYTISGKIENNDFAAADKGLVSADKLTLTLEELEQSGNSGLITNPSESLTVDPGESKITVTGAKVDQDGGNAIITFIGYEILVTNATVRDLEITYKEDSTAIVTHNTVRHMGSSTDIDVELLITNMSKLEEISTPKATIGDAEKARLAAQKITPVSVVDIHHKGEPGFDQITLTISGVSSSGEIIGFHVGESGVDTSGVITQDGKHIVRFTDLTSASPFGIGVISDGPQPPSSSSSGNMENAYRVLFNDGSTTLSVQTDLSSGDKLTKPETPVKDGYTFAGWYKDSACTQGWDFETGISGDMTLYAKWTAAGSSGETEATATPTATAVTTPQPTKTQTAAATTSAPEATTAAGVSPTLTQAPAPVAGALFGLLAAGVLLRRRFQ